MAADCAFSWPPARAFATLTRTHALQLSPAPHFSIDRARIDASQPAHPKATTGHGGRMFFASSHAPRCPRRPVSFLRPRTPPPAIAARGQAHPLLNSGRRGRGARGGTGDGWPGRGAEQHHQQQQQRRTFSEELAFSMARMEGRAGAVGRWRARGAANEQPAASGRRVGGDAPFAAAGLLLLEGSPALFPPQPHAANIPQETPVPSALN